MKMRSCSNCFQTKPESDFYPKRPAGRQSRCKVCNTEVVRAYNRAKRARDVRDRWDVVHGRKKATHEMDKI